MTHSRNPIVKIASLAASLGLFAILTPLAKDFWEEKPFNSWTEKEARRILSDSPWGKIQNVTLQQSEGNPGETRDQTGNVSPSSSPQVPMQGDGRGGGPGGDARGNTSSDQSGQSAPSAGAAGAGVPGSYGGEPASATRSVPFQIIWYSSIKVRQAMGRLGELHGGVTPEQVNSFVQQPMENHIVALSGPMMKPLEQASLESLKGKTFLVSKKNKSKNLELKEYISPKDRKDGLALFVFARTAEGKPTLDMSDDEMQFVTELAGLQIKTAFKLSKMMTDGKLDL